MPSKSPERTRKNKISLHSLVAIMDGPMGPWQRPHQKLSTAVDSGEDDMN